MTHFEALLIRYDVAMQAELQRLRVLVEGICKVYFFLFHYCVLKNLFS